MTRIKTLLKSYWSLIRAIGQVAYSKFSIKDPIGLGGFAAFCYGLHLYSDVMAYTVGGALAVLFSLCLKEKS